MAKFRWDGQELEAIESGDWRADELAEAENALKINAGEARFAEMLQLTFFISRRRANPETLIHMAADEAKGLRMGWLSEEEEDGGPLEETGADETEDTDEPLTTGLRLSAP